MCLCSLVDGGRLSTIMGNANVLGLTKTFSPLRNHKKFASPPTTDNLIIMGVVCVAKVSGVSILTLE